MNPLKLRGGMRRWAGSLGLLLGWAAWLMSGDQTPYEGAIFRRVRAIMPITVWSVVLMFVAAALVAAAVSASPMVWRIAAIGLLTVSCTWFTGVLIAHHVDHVRLSPLGQVLWAWFIVSNFLAVAATSQWEHR